MNCAFFCRLASSVTYQKRKQTILETRMYLYLIFIILSAFSLLELLKLKFKSLPHLYISVFGLLIFIFFLLSSLRWETGTDWDSYYIYYLFLQSEITCIGYMEPGFTLLTSINANCFNYTSQMACIAFLSIAPIAWRYKKISPYPILSLLIWFCTSLAHIFPVRQSIAIAIFVFSWKYIQEKKLKPFLLSIFIAMTFHFTAIITIPIYFIWYKFYSKKVFIYTIITLSIFSLIIGDKMMNITYSIGGAFLQEKLQAYLGNPEETFGSAYTASQILIRGIINRSFFFIIPLLLLNKQRTEGNTLNAMTNLYFYSFCLFLLLTPLSPALGRFCSYTDMTQAILLPYLFYYRIKSKINKYILYIIIIFYLGLRFKGVVNNYYDLYIPYNSILSK